MNFRLLTPVLLAALTVIPVGTMAQAIVGQPAPAFASADLAGNALKLEDYRGKHVVLEWVNPQCPFVKKHYDGGNMPATQKAALELGAVWITVQTTDADAPQAALQEWQQTKGATPTATVIDADGAIARAYGARTTPHMYIVDPQGVLIYAGAIDSKASTNAADIPGATNYVTQALAEAGAGKAISRPTTQAYGCAVKYPAAS